MEVSWGLVDVDGEVSVLEVLVVWCEVDVLVQVTLVLYSNYCK